MRHFRASNSLLNYNRWNTLMLMILMFFTAVSCGSTKNSEDVEKMDQLRNLVESRQFEIQNEWAYPLSGGNINLIGNPNYIRFEGDSVNVFLPYFGVRHSGGGYGTEGGIKFKGVAEDLEVVKGQNENRLLLNFGGDQGNEDLNFTVTLYPNGKARTSVTSSQRQSINYQGEIRERTQSEKK
ncbi:DUF4251 domain-containing protein [Salinimicrobium sp. GXAS 041]|uniref:DUF4251 domain-containing protein n=1 Tax=Salinimicrobium sp. GXAS 041 TaxID=3400806 RepID=UPI003C76ECB7